MAVVTLGTTQQPLPGFTGKKLTLTLAVFE
jgi:hypothetical protein